MKLPSTDPRPAEAHSEHFAPHPMAQPADRLVVLGPNGAWEIRTPNTPGRC